MLLVDILAYKCVCRHIYSLHINSSWSEGNTVFAPPRSPNPGAKIVYVFGFIQGCTWTGRFFFFGRHIYSIHVNRLWSEGNTVFALPDPQILVQKQYTNSGLFKGALELVDCWFLCRQTHSIRTNCSWSERNTVFALPDPQILVQKQYTYSGLFKGALELVDFWFLCRQTHSIRTNCSWSERNTVFALPDPSILVQKTVRIRVYSRAHFRLYSVVRIVIKKKIRHKERQKVENSSFQVYVFGII